MIITSADGVYGIAVTSVCRGCFFVIYIVFRKKFFQEKI